MTNDVKRQLTQDNENRVIIFDTTLRDGEQSPGCSMNLEEKIRMARILDKLGVDVIEAGFPIASEGDFESVREVAKVVENATVAGLCRAKEMDIARAAEAIAPARRGRIHTFISTSPLHMKYKLKMEPEAVLEAIKHSVSFARNLCEDVEWSAEDGSRTEHEFLCRCVEAAIEAGATTINIPDTVGYAIPAEYRALFEMLIDRVPNIDKAVLSVHCHNDLGLAVANSLAGIQGGARQAECTINGIGERAGNAALEEIAMALNVRHDLLNFDTGIQTERITKASRTLSSITGFTVQPNKAIVGANAFAHESGIHQDGMLKNAQTYEIMTPESIGLQKTNLVMGKHSGRNAFKTKMAELGYELGDNALEDAFVRFKALADRKKDIYDEDLISLVDSNLGRSADALEFVSLDVHAGSQAKQEAALEMCIDGDKKEAKVIGNGPVDATFNAIKALFPHDAVLELYQVHAVTGGTDAQAEVTVRLADEESGLTVNGHSADVDVLVASAKAYLNALNRLSHIRERVMSAREEGKQIDVASRRGV